MKANPPQAQSQGPSDDQLIEQWMDSNTKRELAEELLRMKQKEATTTNLLMNIQRKVGSFQGDIQSLISGGQAQLDLIEQKKLNGAAEDEGEDDED